jgi:hypothetical protein
MIYCALFGFEYILDEFYISFLLDTVYISTRIFLLVFIFCIFYLYSFKFNFFSPYKSLFLISIVGLNFLENLDPSEIPPLINETNPVLFNKYIHSISSFLFKDF